MMWKLQASPRPPESLKHLEQSSPCWAGGNGLMRSELSPSTASCRHTTGAYFGHTPLPLAMPSPSNLPGDASQKTGAFGNSWTLITVLSVNWRGEIDGPDTTWTTYQLREACSNRETLKTSAREEERCHIIELSLSPTPLEWSDVKTSPPQQL